MANNTATIHLSLNLTMILTAFDFIVSIMRIKP